MKSIDIGNYRSRWELFNGTITRKGYEVHGIILISSLIPKG